MDYTTTLKLIDRISAPAKAISDRFGGLTEDIKKNQNAVRSLKNQLSSFEELDKLKTKLNKATNAFENQNDRVKLYAQRIKEASKPTQQMALQLKRAERRLEELRPAVKHANQAISNYKKTMSKAGIDTNNLSKEQKRLRGELDKTNKTIDKQSKKLAGWNRLKNIGGNIKQRAGKAINIGKQVGVGALGVGTGITGIIAKFSTTAGEFERYHTILETLEKSSEKADTSFAWIKEFTAKTPYEMGQVTDAFVKLKAYGMDPIQGDLLKTLGDTSAAMGKDVIQAVEAIADAVTGENERLKEFGIKASAIKGTNNIEYRYTDSNGKEMVKTVDKNNRAMIQSTLQAIWNEKYAGGMDKMSGTWQGMLSNLSDYWSNFQTEIMSAGAFDWLKGKLDDLLFELDFMTRNGELKEWAQSLSDKIILFGEAIWTTGNKIYNFATKISNTANSVAKFAGGWDNLLVGLVAFKGLGMTASIASLALSLSPITLLVLGITAAVAAGLIAWNKWDAIMGYLQTNFPSIHDFFAFTLPDAIDSTVQAIKDLIDWVNSGIESLNKLAAQYSPSKLGHDFGVSIKNFFTGEDKPKSVFKDTSKANTSPIKPQGSEHKVKVEVVGKNVESAKVKNISSSGTGLRFDTGQAMVAM